MRRIVMVACAVTLLAPLIMKSRTVQSVPERTAFRALSSGRVSIKLCGEFLHPGIYEVAANSMAVDVIKLAVPLSPRKQYVIAPSVLKPLLDGSTVTLATQADGTYSVTLAQMTVPERLIMNIPLDISTMNEADFDRLPGVGPVMARRIAEYRHNNGGKLRVEDLASIEGIGEKRFKMLSGYFKCLKYGN